MINNKKFKQFPITSVCREDLEEAGFDASGVDDDAMKQIASKMADAYLEIIFWIDLPLIAEYCEVPRNKLKNELE